jgi:hypothetical protein
MRSSAAVWYSPAASVPTSAATVADPAGLADHLYCLGRAWTIPNPRFERHFAVVRQVMAELGHIPAPTVQARQEARPCHVRAEFVRHLTRLRSQGLLGPR